VTDLVPDFDEGLSFGVTPGQASFLQRVGAMSPPFAPLVRPGGEDTAVGERMKLRVCCSGRHRWRCGGFEWKNHLRLILAGALFFVEQNTEPSLDTSDARSSSISFHGPQNTHGMPPKC
jgi:hypothetical protein